MTKKLSRDMIKCVCGNFMNPNDFACSKCMIDLYHRAGQRTAKIYSKSEHGNDVRFEIFLVEDVCRGIEPVGLCSICGGNYVCGGCNPAPVIIENNARCCSKCKHNIVVPARIRELESRCKEYIKQNGGSAIYFNVDQRTTILNSLGINKCIVEFMRYNGWIKEWFANMDFEKYTHFHGNYRHLPPDEKKRIISKVRIPNISVCKKVPEHYDYWIENFNLKKKDCCNL